jgi:hypothetical protein
LAFTFPSTFKSVQQHPELVLAPDYRRKSVTAESLEPILAKALAFHPVSAERRGKSL